MNRAFIPETQILHPEKEPTALVLGCSKPSNHDHYLSTHELSLEHLPNKWRTQDVLDDLKMVSRRIVHLTVTKSSLSRPDHSNNNGHSGSGFITFHPVHGAIINTSKHVVYDPFEAEHTIVRVFYEDDNNSLAVTLAINSLTKCILTGNKGNDTQSGYLPAYLLNQEKPTSGLFLCRGSKRHFQSVMCTDYTAFSCDLPVHELFKTEEIEKSNIAFSWWSFNLRRFIFSSQFDEDVDVAVISHPHSGAKRVSFGKMQRLVSLHPSLYDAATCTGSSGAPIIRLHLDRGHYISAGQFVHHGHNKNILNMGMGTVRPPITLPYWKPLDTENGLANAVGILYEPILYWTLVVCDLLHIQSTLHNSLDVFAYTSSFSALILSVDSMCFKVLNTGYWLHLLLTTIIMARQGGFVYALCCVIGTAISMAMFLVSWVLLHFISWSVPNMLLVCLVWLVVLYIERYFYLSARFRFKTVGSFPEFVKYRLALKQGVKAKKSKRNDLVTTQPAG